MATLSTFAETLDEHWFTSILDAKYGITSLVRCISFQTMAVQILHIFGFWSLVRELFLIGLWSKTAEYVIRWSGIYRYDMNFQRALVPTSFPCISHHLEEEPRLRPKPQTMTA